MLHILPTVFRRSPAIEEAERQIILSNRQRRVGIVKQRARTYLNPSTRWQLEMVSKGLQHMDVDEAMDRLAWCLQQPSYHHFVALMNLRGATLMFRYLRLCERRAAVAVGE